MKKKFSTPLPVLICGVGGGSYGAQILKALRFSGNNYFIIGADIDRTSKGLAEVDRAYIVPRADDPDFQDSFMQICEKENVKAVFHGSELVMMHLANMSRQLAKKNIFLPVNPDSVLATCQDKVDTVSFLRQNGFSFPSYLEISSLDEVKGFSTFPVVLKPSVQSGGSANVFIAQSQEELETFTRYLLQLYNKFILQEYVGTPDQEYTVGVLFGADGTLLNSIAVKRIIKSALSTSLRVPNRTARKELGNSLVISSGISQGHIGRFPHITSICEKIGLALKATAPINIQCRYVGDQVVTFEINPRFSGTTFIRALAGYNEPDLLIRREVLGESVEPFFAYDECTVMRGLHEKRLPGTSIPNC